MNKTIEILRREGEGHSHEILGMRHQYKARPSEGAPNLMFVMDVPPGCGAPLHHHEKDGEAFYMLDGEITFVTPDAMTVARPGDYFYAGPGHVHSFVNASGRPAQALIVQTPGVDAEIFFDSVAAAGAAGGFDPQRDLPAIAAEHGLTIHPPKVAQAA